MNITIDGQPTPATFDAPMTLGGMVEQIRDHLAPGGRMVIGISANGSDLSPEHIQGDWNSPVTEFSTLNFTTESNHTLLDAAMEQADAVLENTLTAAGDIADQLQKGNTQQGMGAFLELMRQWQQVHQGVVNAVALLSLDPQQVMVGEMDMVNFFAEFRAFLDQLKDVVQSRDTVLLGDTLTYEVEPMIASWKICIESIRRQSHAAMA